MKMLSTWIENLVKTNGYIQFSIGFSSNKLLPAIIGAIFTLQASLLLPSASLSRLWERKLQQQP